MEICKLNRFLAMPTDMLHASFHPLGVKFFKLAEYFRANYAANVASCQN